MTHSLGHFSKLCARFSSLHPPHHVRASRDSGSTLPPRRRARPPASGRPTCRLSAEQAGSSARGRDSRGSAPEGAVSHARTIQPGPPPPRGRKSGGRRGPRAAEGEAGTSAASTSARSRPPATPGDPGVPRPWVLMHSGSAACPARVEPASVPRHRQWDPSVAITFAFTFVLCPGLFCPGGAGVGSGRDRTWPHPRA